MSTVAAKFAMIGLATLTVLGGCVVVEDGDPPPPALPGQRPQVCAQIYAPVCGVRGSEVETLPNQCVARARGYRVIREGECGRGQPSPPPVSRPPDGGRPQFCTQEYDPVCARRGSQIRTFGNACSARADGFRVIHGGRCG